MVGKKGQPGPEGLRRHSPELGCYPEDEGDGVQVRRENRMGPKEYQYVRIGQRWKSQKVRIKPYLHSLHPFHNRLGWQSVS